MAESVNIRPVRDTDRDAVISIFNHYIVSGYAAYPDEPVRKDFFRYLRERTFSFLVLEVPGGIVGFGLTKPLLPFPAFSGTCTLTYFIAPGYTKRGLGTLLLDRLTTEARTFGIIVMVANMASKNHASLRFHKKHGFTEAGRLNDVGKKFGEPFDLIWMQKEI